VRLGLRGFAALFFTPPFILNLLTGGLSPVGLRGIKFYAFFRYRNFR
jgi:hypothetical protein